MGQKNFFEEFGAPHLFFSAQFVYEIIKQFIFNCFSLAYVNNSFKFNLCKGKTDFMIPL